MPQHTDAILQRARLLLDQRRFKEAEQQLGTALQNNPENDETLGLLGRLKIDTQLPNEAIAFLNQALHHNPQEDYYMYLLAFAHYKLDMHASAMEELDRAIAVNPYHTGYYALYAFILGDERKFEAALDRANAGLAIDPEDLGCLNARSRALNKLGRTDDAISTMQDTLAADPENDFSHTTIGWNYLEKGKHKQAAHHFREALRINPTNIGARDGMKEALKSSIAPYRWSLQYGMWLNNKGKNARIIFILGIYVAFRISLAAANHLQGSWSVLVYFILGLYLLAVLTSWVIEPVANFFLLFHKEGKYALTKSEKLNSQTVIAAMSLGLVCFLVYLLAPVPEEDEQTFLIAAIISASMALPLAQLHYPISWKGNKAHQWYGIIVGGLGLAALMLIIFNLNAGILVAGIYGAALVIGSWVVSFTNR